MTAVSVPTRTQLFIAGEYSDGSGQERYDVISPSTGEFIASIPVPTEEDLNRAVAKAHEAKGAWQKLGVLERHEICHKIGDAMERRIDELAHLQSMEQGKPLAESIADVTEAAQLFHLHAEDAIRLNGETIPSSDTDKRMFTFRAAARRLGHHHPVELPTAPCSRSSWHRALPPATHTSWKPAANTALTVLAAMECLIEAGVPEGLVSILPGEGDFGAKLVSHDGIDAIGFIGSSATAAKNSRRPRASSAPSSRCSTATARSSSSRTPTSSAPPRPPSTAHSSAPARSAAPPNAYIPHRTSTRPSSRRSWNTPRPP